MRHPAGVSPIPCAGAARLRRGAAILLTLISLSACSVLRGGEQADITGDSTDEINWSQSRTAMLEAENADLRAENAELTQKLADFQKAAARAKAAAAEADDEMAVETAEVEIPAAPPAKAQTPAVKPETVVAAADADNALAESPVKPVDQSPRLVQPSFASEQETVFENEADADSIHTESVLYGVHLASYRKSREAAAGWRLLQRENPDELGLLEPRIEQVTINGRGDFLRLIAGGFSSQEKASQLCEMLKPKGVYCAVTGFIGQKLSLADAG